MTEDELKKTSGIDPNNIPESAWEVYRVDPDGVWREDICWIQKPAGEGQPGISLKRKVNLQEQFILESNRQQYDTDQKMIRKGGELDAKVASVPLNILYNDDVLLEGIKDRLLHR